MKTEQTEFFDLVFPQKLRPLTYRKPAGMELSPGVFVRAELGKKIKTALVLSKSKEAWLEELPPIKDISDKAGPWALSPGLLKLLSWMAEYYMAEEGSVLKVMYGDAGFETPGRKRKKGGNSPLGLSAAELRAEEMPSADLFGKAGFRTFLIHAEGTSYERAFVKSSIRELIGAGLRGAIIIVPEISKIHAYESLLRPIAGERLAVLHGELGIRERAEAYQRVLEEKSDIVLGTRLAVFAPLSKLSLIIVTEEQSENYKNEEGVRYQARDVAVARASFEGAKAVLTSICPSAESYLNCLKGKYELLSPTNKGFPGEKRIRLINMRNAALESHSISKPLFKALSSALNKGRQALIILNRLGHSVPFCEDCGHAERCPSCKIALTLHKTKKILSCSYCGFKKGPSDTCAVCGGHDLKLLGSGLERLSEELKTLFPDIPLSPAGGRLLYGTKGILKNVPDNSVEIAAVLNPELGFLYPDFRSRERAFQDLIHLADKVVPGGHICIQTMEPGLFRDMKDMDYGKFIETELAERRALLFPPFSKIAVLDLAGPGRIEMPHLKGAEVLGPAPRLGKKGQHLTTLLIKAQSGTLVRQAVRAITNKARTQKIRIDIDPV